MSNVYLIKEVGTEKVRGMALEKSELFIVRVYGVDDSLPEPTTVEGIRELFATQPDLVPEFAYFIMRGYKDIEVKDNFARRGTEVYLEHQCVV